MCEKKNKELKQLGTKQATGNEKADECKAFIAARLVLHHMLAMSPGTIHKFSADGEMVMGTYQRDHHEGGS